MKKNEALILLAVFGLGYITNDIISTTDKTIIPTAHAEVAGMDAYDLEYDYDFKQAVESIIEDCEYTGGYIEDGYLYGGELDC